MKHRAEIQLQTQEAINARNEAKALAKKLRKKVYVVWFAPDEDISNQKPVLMARNEFGDLYLPNGKGIKSWEPTQERPGARKNIGAMIELEEAEPRIRLLN